VSLLIAFLVTFRLRNDLYCVEGDVKLYYTIPYFWLLQTSETVWLYTLRYHGISFDRFFRLWSFSASCFPQ